MNPAELRIGNWVQLSGEECQVTAVNPETARNFQPIPLTEEWLEKFGFVNDRTKQQRHMNVKVGGRTLSFWQPQIDKIIFTIDIIHDVHIRYVHQLQNLCFAVTGEELNIK